MLSTLLQCLWRLRRNALMLLSRAQAEDFLLRCIRQSAKNIKASARRQTAGHRVGSNIILSPECYKPVLVASPAFQSVPQYGFLFSFSHFLSEEKDPQLLSHVAVFIWLKLRPCWRHQDFATNFSSHVWKYWSICYTNCMATIHCASLNCIHTDKMFYCTWSIPNEHEPRRWNYIFSRATVSAAPYRGLYSCQISRF